MRGTSPLSRALFLVLGCTVYRLLSGMYPGVIPNFSPLLAVSLVGAMILPRSWGWAVGPLSLILTELAFLTENYVVEGTVFSWWTLAFLLFCAAVGWLGGAISKHKSLGKVIGASVICSLAFYLLANTFSWWNYSGTGVSPAYAQTLAGWWQANTIGLPGWLPTWTFLRNGLLGDLLFVIILLLIFERDWLLGSLGLRVRRPTSSSA